VVLAVQRALQTLRALGCGGHSSCLILVKTDGDETEDRELLARGHTREELLDNAGVRVVLCGFASVSQDVSRRGHRASTVRELDGAWRSLFARKELVTVEPHCGVAARGPMARNGGHQ
jgi:hypothetical protein